MKARIFFWSLTSALAGFLFGFDTVVISGAEQTIQQLWGLSAGLHGLAMGAALYGTVLGSLLGGWPADRFGRRATLLWIGALYFVSAVWSALATEVYSFSVARFIGGLGVGISTVAAPMYIAEIAPPAWRGRLAGMFQFNIVFGILVAFLSNALIARVGGELAWRWMLGVEAFPALLYTLLCFGMPESPRWLIVCRGDLVCGREVLRLIEPEAGEDQLRADADAILASAANDGPAGRVLDAPVAGADSAGGAGGVFQPAFGHQRGVVLRAAHLRVDGPGPAGGAVANGGDWPDQSGVHLCGAGVD